MVASNWFTAEDRRAIADAVAAAERTTTGEIVPVVATASDHYERAEDLVGLVGACVAVAAGWALFQQLTPGDWGESHELALQLPAILLLLLGGFALGVMLARWLPWLKHLFVARRTMAARVLIAAHHAFDALHVRKTAGGTGIVLYVSLFERRVCVWADRAVAAQVAETEWHETCAILSRALQQGRARAGFVDAIGRCGELLGRHFPAQSRDQDELTNELRVLD